MGENKNVEKAEEKKEGKIKAHFKKHRFKYGVGIGLVVGGTVVYFFVKARGGANVDVTNKQLIAVNSPITNNITNEYHGGTRRGHAGNAVRCIETGEEWDSQNLLCKEKGIDGRDLWGHLKGYKEDINGLHYERKGTYNSDTLIPESQR